MANELLYGAECVNPKVDVAPQGVITVSVALKRDARSVRSNLF